MSGTLVVDTETKPSAPVAYWRLITASTLCMVMFGAVLAVPPACLDAIGDEFGVEYEARGLLITLRMAALLVSLLIVGWLGEGPAKRHFLFWGLIGIGAAQGWGAEAGAYSGLQMAMILSGLGKGVVEALLNPLVAQLHPTRSATALNLLNGLFSVGLVAGALSAGELQEAGYSWRHAFWLWALAPVICAFLFMTPRYPVPQTHAVTGVSTGDNVRRFLRMPLFWALVVAMVMGGGCEAGLTSWAPNFTADVLGASARFGAFATALYGVAMAIGRFGSGALVMRMSPVRLMIISAALCGAATLGLTFAPNLTVVYILFSLGGLFVACFWPTLLSVASDHIATGSTSLFSLLAAAGVGGCVLFPWAIGRLGDMLGLRSGVLVLPVSMVILVIVLAFIPRLIRASKESETGH